MISKRLCGRISKTRISPLSAARRQTLTCYPFLSHADSYPPRVRTTHSNLEHDCSESRFRGTRWPLRPLYFRALRRPRVGEHDNLLMSHVWENCQPVSSVDVAQDAHIGPCCETFRCFSGYRCFDNVFLSQFADSNLRGCLYPMIPPLPPSNAPGLP